MMSCKKKQAKFRKNKKMVELLSNRNINLLNFSHFTPPLRWYFNHAFSGMVNLSSIWMMGHGLLSTKISQNT